MILGKTNLSEWANFRGNGADQRLERARRLHAAARTCSTSTRGLVVGLRRRGSREPGAVAVGTETDGSITAPAAELAIVGLKPTVGLVSQRGIIPIAASQDTAGPMCRTVTDAALLLNAIRSPVRRGATDAPLPARLHRVPEPPARSARARLAYDLRYVEGDLGPGDDDAPRGRRRPRSTPCARPARGSTRSRSADPTAPTPDGRIPFDDEFTVLLFEFKVQVAAYLAAPARHATADARRPHRLQPGALRGGDARTSARRSSRLAEATSGDLRDPEYLAAWATNRAFGRSVIDGALAAATTAVLTPGYSCGASPAATAGYPSMSVPIGFDRRAAGRSGCGWRPGSCRSRR